MNEHDSDRHRISRRRLLGSGAAAGAGAVLAGSPAAQAASQAAAGRRSNPATGSLKADVCVVGAGISGLTAARTIRKSGKSVIVLEARNRVGGRCFSQPIPGASDVANMGATFVGPTQLHVLALMAELGIGKFDTYSTGKLLWYESGKLTPYTGTIPPASNPLAVIQLGTMTVPQLDKMAKTVPTDAPWNAPNALAWDSMTTQTWIEQNVVAADGQKILALAVEGALSVEPQDVSFLYLLWYINQAGGTNQLFGNAGTGAGQDFRVKGGTQLISITMAQQLGLGKRVLLNQPVRHIRQGARGATVIADGASIECKQVIVAIAPNLAGKIDYTPNVTAMRMQLTQRVPIGSLIKTIAVYPTPFWRTQGLNAQVTSDQGPVKVMFDASPESGTPGVLLGFIDGNDARALDDSSAADRKAAALKSYVTYFGQQAANPVQYIDHVWAQELYTGGCPVGVTPPGVLTEYGPALRAPIGRIHWAGTETADVWAGYMDGGVQAGQRAAAEALAKL
ncbi:MAG: flavin monoamine oxidase family protein [Solirubrobacteraceae bacterium]